MTEIHILKNRRIYYKEKVLKMNEKLFIETGDARSRICNCENIIESAYLASLEIRLPIEIKSMWKKYWEELNKDASSCIRNQRGIMLTTPIYMTLRKKKNKTMQKYLFFFYNELFRVLDPNFLSDSNDI